MNPTLSSANPDPQFQSLLESLAEELNHFVSTGEILPALAEGLDAYADEHQKPVTWPGSVLKAVFRLAE